MQKHLLTAVAALCFAVAGAQPTTNGLVAYWPLNGNFTDAGPNTIAVTNTGVTATTGANGTANAAMFFNNALSSTATVVPATSFGAVTINSALNFGQTASYTVAHWFRITNASSTIGSGFFDNCMNYNGYATWLWRSSGTGNPIQVHFNAGGINVQSPVATTTINLNTWYHLAGVKDGTTLRLYINGLQVATATGAFGVPSYAYQPKFGTLYFNQTGYFNYAPFNGSLDDMRIYNRALTPAEVAVLASSPSGGPLPVKLTSFTAALNNGAAVLNWQTEYEINSSHYIVQRSTDGVDFTSIGTVQAKGNTTLKSDYQYIDNTAGSLSANKTIFYRLQQVDKDSRSQHSSIIPVKFESTDKLITILQNPVANELRLQLVLKQTEQLRLDITDATGKTVTSKQVTLQQGQTFTTLPVNQLSSGAYYITITAGQQKQTLSFIKQ